MVDFIELHVIFVLDILRLPRLVVVMFVLVIFVNVASLLMYSELAVMS